MCEDDGFFRETRLQEEVLLYPPSLYSPVKGIVFLRPEPIHGYLKRLLEWSSSSVSSI